MPSTTPSDQGRPAPEPTLPERLASARERLLLVAALAYALGYAARAVHAWFSNFGVLPAVRFEYLVAGTLLLLPMSALGLLLWAAALGAAALRTWRIKRPVAALRLRRSALAVLVVAVLWMFVVDPDRVARLAGSQGTLAVLAVSAAFAFGFVLIGGLFPLQPSRTRAAVNVVLAVQVAATFACAALLGAELLPTWPQELGGMQPKCARLDLAVQELSPETRELLVPAAAVSAPERGVVRSHPLALVSASGPWLIQLRGTRPGEPLRRAIRLPESAVRSVEWLAPARFDADGTPGCAGS